MSKVDLTSFQAWEERVPKAIKGEITWDFYAYRKALFLYDLCWYDCEKLLRDWRGRKVSDQLIDSAGSISANIEEAYGRGLGTKEFLQFMRYSIGSAKETKGWYFRARHLLSDEVVDHRLKILSEVCALILTEIKKQRKRAESK